MRSLSAARDNRWRRRSSKRRQGWSRRMRSSWPRLLLQSCRRRNASLTEAVGNLKQFNGAMPAGVALPDNCEARIPDLGGKGVIIAQREQRPLHLFAVGGAEV